MITCLIFYRGKGEVVHLPGMGECLRVEGDGYLGKKFVKSMCCICSVFSAKF